MRAGLVTINGVQLSMIAMLSLIFHYSLYRGGKRLPYSQYYENDAARLESLAERRREESRQVLADIREYKSRDDLDGPLFSRNQANRLCVCMITVARQGGADYLTQSIAALLSRTPWELQHQIRIFIHNLNSPPGDHKEALRLQDLVLVKSVSYDAELRPDSLGPGRTKLKETIDYITTLKVLLDSDCDYALVLEDDALAATNWAPDLLCTLRVLESSGPRPWIVLKLFSSFKWIPWFFGESHAIFDVFLLCVTTIAAMLSIIAIYWILITLLFRLGRQERDDFGRFEYPKGRLVEPNMLSMLVLSISVGVFLYLMGRPNVFPYEDGIHSVSIGASAVANLYSRAGLKLLRDHLTNEFFRLKDEGRLSEMKNKDLHFRRIREEMFQKSGVSYHELVRLPNLFQHIGAHTSLDKFSSFATEVVSPHFPDDEERIQFDERMVTGTTREAADLRGDCMF